MEEKVIQCFSNGDLWFIHNEKNKLLHGLCTAYKDEDHSKLLYDVYYINDERDGEAIEYH